MIDVLKKELDANVLEKFMNRNASARAKKNNDKALYQTELCKSGLLIPQTILKKAESFDFDKFKK
jgi:hypothetical protein